MTSTPKSGLPPPSALVDPSLGLPAPQHPHLLHLEQPMRGLADAALVEQVLTFARRFYPHSSPGQLTTILDCDQMVVRLCPQAREPIFLAGYSLIDMTHQGEQCLGIYFDLMLCHEQARGQGFPHHAYFKALLQSFARAPLRRKQVFLAVETAAAYIGLVRYAPSTYPVHREATPHQQQRWLDAFGQMKFGERYDPATGVIRGVTALDHRHSSTPRRAREPDAHARYFLERVPANDRGDTLLVTAPLSFSNVFGLFAEMVKKRLGLRTPGR